ncbi:hypothetical protein SKAU_G00340110 [Synaphobranchus kaupii]|uniref:Uncharacterized protein n=1 Tax=Synaphobranchus kaupii TaxID=118154 RepID=A0A9Q1EMT0_SYNKA|nr:hypothetical protein SKAU_G00340110 [Synaphobranchus kaupii]
MPKPCDEKCKNILQKTHSKPLPVAHFWSSDNYCTLKDLEEMVLSATAVFSSPCSGSQVEKRFKSLQHEMTSMGNPLSESHYAQVDDHEDVIGPTPFDEHFKVMIANVPLDLSGEKNLYYSKTFVPALATYFLPQAASCSETLEDMERGCHAKSFEEISKKKHTEEFSKV